jgi:uncharacterized lipoprotein NlpE involved in copper resistance
LLNIIPYLRKNISISLTLYSAVLIILLATNPLIFFSLLQPVQASSIGSSSSRAMSFRTPTPAKGTMTDAPPNDATLTFDAQGTDLVTPEKLNTKGTYLITSREEGTLYNGSIVLVQGCCLTNNSVGEGIHLFADQPSNYGIVITTSCSTSATNNVYVYSDGGGNFIGAFQGAVECSPQAGGGNTTTQQQSSSMTGTTQDGDGDGIPDAGDRCPHTPHPRCFKEAT